MTKLLSSGRQATKLLIANKAAEKSTRQLCSCPKEHAADVQHSTSKRTVDVPGVSDVVLQVLQGGLASHNGLDEEAEHGEHSQTAVLDLLHLQAQNTSVRMCSAQVHQPARVPA